jgi:hypothetical protein
LKGFTLPTHGCPGTNVTDNSCLAHLQHPLCHLKPKWLLIVRRLSCQSQDTTMIHTHGNLVTLAMKGTLQVLNPPWFPPTKEHMSINHRRGCRQPSLSSLLLETEGPLQKGPSAKSGHRREGQKWYPGLSVTVSPLQYSTISENRHTVLYQQRKCYMNTE